MGFAPNSTSSPSGSPSPSVSAEEGDEPETSRSYASESPSPSESDWSAATKNAAFSIALVGRAEKGSSTTALDSAQLMSTSARRIQSFVESRQLP